MKVLAFLPFLLAVAYCGDKNEKFKKIGCFKKNEILFHDIMTTDLDPVHHNWGGAIDWNNFGQSLQTLAGRCAIRAKGKYLYFAIGFFGECWAGSNTKAIRDTFYGKPWQHLSDQCVKGDESPCEVNSEHCEGTRENVYVYQIVEGLRCMGIDNNCCTTGSLCIDGDGDCDRDDQCEPGLKCGKNNCLWGDNDDCCYNVTASPCASMNCGAGSTCYVVGDTPTCRCIRGFYEESPGVCAVVKNAFSSEIKLKKKFNNNLKNPKSPEFASLASELGTSLTESIKRKMPNVQSVIITGFKEGSIVVDFDIVMPKNLTKGSVSPAQLTDVVDSAVTDKCMSSFGVDPEFKPKVKIFDKCLTSDTNTCDDLTEECINNDETGEYTCKKRTKEFLAKFWPYLRTAITSSYVLKTPDLRCGGINSNCCTKETPCLEGDGDCNTDEDCSAEEGLKCGKNNCLWTGNDNCCYK